MARLYNKTRQLQCYAPDDEKVLTETKAFLAAGWDGCSPVWRLEGQLRSEALRSLGVNRPEDIESMLDPIWQHLFVGGTRTGAWLRLVDPKTSTRRERCSVDERLKVFTEVRFSLGASEPAQRVLGRRRGLSVPEVTGGLLSHLGSAGLLQTPCSKLPMEQLERDTCVFLDQVRASRVAHDYLQRRAAASARFAGLDMPPRVSGDTASSTDVVENVVPPTVEERTSLTFLEYVRQREADLFSNAPDFQRTPTFDERPEFVARTRYYERRLRAYSEAWTNAPTRRAVPDTQLSLASIASRLQRKAGE